MSILENCASRNSIFENHTLLFPQGYHHLVGRGFLQRLRPLKAAGVISIHTINHFLNEVNSFKMLCVTPE